jgi:hypothetical protein
MVDVTPDPLPSVASSVIGTDEDVKPVGHGPPLQ